MVMRERVGILFVVSAPSGAGKTSICRAVMERRGGISFSVSATTRDPRPGEVDGRDYLFVSTQEFRSMIERDELVEWAEVHGHLYGTPLRPLVEGAEQGRDFFLDIDVQGASRVLRYFPNSVGIFVMPPSVDVIHQRLKGRGTEDPQELAQRIAAAEREIAQFRIFHYLLLNDDFEQAVKDMCSIIDAERQKTAYLREVWW
jgi:guanylate kinase